MSLTVTDESQVNKATPNISSDSDEDGADVADDGSGTGSDGEESGEKGAYDEGWRGGVSHKGLRKASTTQSSSGESALRFTPQMVRTPIALCINSVASQSYCIVILKNMHCIHLVKLYI